MVGDDAGAFVDSRPGSDFESWRDVHSCGRRQTDQVGYYVGGRTQRGVWAGESDQGSRAHASEGYDGAENDGAGNVVNLSLFFRLILARVVVVMLALIFLILDIWRCMTVNGSIYGGI